MLTAPLHLPEVGLTCQQVLDAVVVCEAVGSGRGGRLVPGQRLAQVHLQPVEGRQAAVVLRGGKGQAATTQQATRGELPGSPT